MKITFSSKLSTFVVRAPEGTLISLSTPPAELGDGVYAVGDSGIVLVDEEYQTDTIYLSTEGEDYTVETGERICYPAEDIIVWGGNAPDRNPFPKSGKGGGGSGSITIYYTTTALTDNATTNPITVNGESVTVNANEFAIYGKKEFVFDGAHWHEFGDLTDTVGRVDYVDTNTEGVGYPANGEVFNSDINSATARGAHAEGIAARAFGEGSHAESYSMAQAQGSHAHGASIVTSTAAFATAMGDHATAQAPSSTVVGTYNKTYNTSQGETIPDLLFVVGNGKGMVFNPQPHFDMSNIVEVDYTSMNVNGDIQRSGVSLPTPYTTMPTITAGMLGQIAMYVGTTDANYTQGWFYIASSDGAAEPTYSWVHLPTQNGYSETVLYTASSPHTNSIELSQAYTNFDEIVIVWKYSSPAPDTVDNYSVRYTKTYKVSTFGDGVVFLCSEETSATQAFTAYILGDTTHINYDSKIGTLYNWIAKVIGIKYGSNGGAVANPARNLAKSEEKEKPIEEEEPTDEMR